MLHYSSPRGCLPTAPVHSYDFKQQKPQLMMRSLSQKLPGKLSEIVDQKDILEVRVQANVP